MSEETADKMISIELPKKYWIVVLSGLEFLVGKAHERLEEMKRYGLNIENFKELPSPVVTSLVGPLIARAMVVDELVKEGVMTEEAGSKLGTEWVQRLIDHFLQQ
jgi:hypothetical protein